MDLVKQDAQRRFEEFMEEHGYTSNIYSQLYIDYQTTYNNRGYDFQVNYTHVEGVLTIDIDSQDGETLNDEEYDLIHQWFGDVKEFEYTNRTLEIIFEYDDFLYEYDLKELEDFVVFSDHIPEDRKWDIENVYVSTPIVKGESDIEGFVTLFNRL